MSRLTPEEQRELAEVVVHTMTSMVGPMGDMTRAAMSAKVDGLIDARRRLIGAGWPEWMVHAALMAFITGQPAPFVVNGSE